MASATVTMASVMLSPRLMLIPTTMVDMVLDMALATATMASVMLSPRLMLIPTTMVDMVLDMALATATMASVMLSPRLMLLLARLYLLSSTHYVDIKMLPTLLIVNKNQMIPLFSLTANFLDQEYHSDSQLLYELCIVFSNTK